MKNVFLILVIAIATVFTACQSNTSEELNGTHKVLVKEVLEANAYTYLNVEENDTVQWIAVSKMEAKVGETYYFDEFMEMKYFESKDLGRVFESIYFIQELRKTLEKKPVASQGKMPAGHMSAEEHAGKPEITKNEIKVDPIEGGITIAELYSNREKYNGKKVIIRGKIVKVNFAIMNKNWFHIQDGTSAEGNFDLTITTMEEEIKINEIVTVEGTIILNKDFGYGYSYEVLLQEAVIK
ncbi:MAG: hypothetical protein GQ564_10555 [Bacteroidales bacterium]|nr:hypothetical protein [Bacteroidales bacterium]